MHLTCAIVHGHSINVFLDHNQFPHGGDCTVTVLMLLLKAMEPFPECLYIQLDNTVKENKVYKKPYLSLVIIY